MAVDMNMNVLIVDDYKTMLRIIEKLLKQLGIKNVHQATDGAAALKVLREVPCGLIISDWNMPVCTGIELLHRVRKSKLSEHIPFIFITAESEAFNITEAKKAGATEYIVKPFTTTDLVERCKLKVKQTAA